jgi:branched-chain amino acid transport system substrate-binding protein
MRFPRARRTLALTLASAILATPALATTVVAARAADTKRVVTIGVIAPLDDGLTSFGRGIRSSVELAVDQANEENLLPGWTIKVRALDDSSDPAVGVKAAKKLAKDPTVVAVVGPYNSGVSEEILPVLAAKDLALVSPSNTLTSLTVGPDATAPKRPYDSYFRMVGPDSLQADFLAKRARALGLSRAAVVSETKAVSKGLADSFVTAFTAGGGTAVVRMTVPDGATAAQFADFVTTASGASPDLLFFGGEYDVGAVLRSTATKAGLVAPLMGGDGINDPAYITGAGSAAAGTYASGTGLPIEQLANGDDFLAAYAAGGYKSDPTNYGPYAYDATNAVLATLPAIIAQGTSGGSVKSATKLPSDVRRAVVTALQATDMAGITGRVAFDSYGDTLDPQFTLYRVGGSPPTWTAIAPL